MRYELPTSSITYYCEFNGEQKADLFIVRFCYGRVVDETTDLQFNKEIIFCTDMDDIQAEMNILKKYCLDREYKQVKTKKKNAIT